MMQAHAALPRPSAPRRALIATRAAASRGAGHAVPAPKAKAQVAAKPAPPRPSPSEGSATAASPPRVVDAASVPLPAPAGQPATVAPFSWTKQVRVV